MTIKFHRCAYAMEVNTIFYEDVWSFPGFHAKEMDFVSSLSKPYRQLPIPLFHTSLRVRVN